MGREKGNGPDDREGSFEEKESQSSCVHNSAAPAGDGGVKHDLLTSDEVDNSKDVDDCTCHDDDGSSTSDNGDVHRTRRSVSTKKRKERDEPNYEVKSGARFLQQLDRDYLCSPRLIVRGEYTGQVLKVIAKRKTEGTMVDWTIFDMNKKTQLLNVKGEMTYPYGLVKYSHNPYVWHFGNQVKGGWQWQGYGWGFINLFPNSNESDRDDPTKILHIDIEEAVFYQESVFHYYHLSGQNCTNVSKSENINCKEDGCGVQIWSIKFTSYTTAEEEPQISQLQPKRRRKEREVAHVFLSLVAFFDGEYKLVLHRDCPLKKYIEEVAWLAKDVKKFNDDFAAMNTLKIDNARYIWSTTVPKPVSGGNTLVDEVNISDQRELVCFVCLFVCLFVCMYKTDAQVEDCGKSAVLKPVCEEDTVAAEESAGKRSQIYSCCKSYSFYLVAMLVVATGDQIDYVPTGEEMDRNSEIVVTEITPGGTDKVELRGANLEPDPEPLRQLSQEEIDCIDHAGKKIINRI